TVAVDIVDASLSDTDNSSSVTFTFSEAPGASFSEGDIQVSGLTLVSGSLVQDDATHYHATVTANDNFTGSAWVPVAEGAFSHTAGNACVGCSLSLHDALPISTVAVDIVDASLSDTDNSSSVTFTFSEAPGASFSEGDIQVSGLTLVSGSL